MELREVNSGSEHKLAPFGKSRGDTKIKRGLILVKQLFRNKCFLVSLSVSGIVFIWILVLIPLLVRVIDIESKDKTANNGGSSVSNQRSSNLTQRLPPLNLTNLTSNASRITVLTTLCINSFIFSPNDSFCFPSCDWDPYDANIATFKQVFYVVLNIAGLILGIGTLGGWIATSCIDWKKKRIRYDFQLARTSLFMVVISSLALLVINVTVDLLNRSYLYCSSGESGEQFLPAHLNHYTSGDSSVRIVINLIGALYHYFSICSLIWLSVSFFNIFLIVYFPMRDKHKRKMLVFLIECVVSYFAPILPILLAVALDSDSPYGVVYTLQQIYVFDAWLNTILHNWLYFLISGIIITLSILIVLKLRFNSIHSKVIMGKSIKLTELEKRMLVYSLVLMLTLFLIGTQLLAVNLIADDYHLVIEEYILCSTVNSPVQVSTASSNATYLVYRVNTIGGPEACRNLLNIANNKYPSWAYILLSLFFRLIWFIPFIILIPCCACRCFKKQTPNSKVLLTEPIVLKFKSVPKSKQAESVFVAN